MKDIDALERAYRNGYEAGKAELTAQCNQLQKERDAAVACIEALKDDFVDYVCSGTSNTNPYCANKTDNCTDKRGWCVYVKNCRGFKPKAYEEWRKRI